MFKTAVLMQQNKVNNPGVFQEMGEIEHHAVKNTSL